MITRKARLIPRK